MVLFSTAMRRLKLRPHIANHAAAFHIISELVSSAKGECLDLAEVLFDDADERVNAEWEKRKDKVGKSGVTAAELTAVTAAWKGIGKWMLPQWEGIRDGDQHSDYFNSLCDRKKGCLQFHTVSSALRVETETMKLAEAQERCYRGGLNPMSKLKLEQAKDLCHLHAVCFD